MSDSTLVPLSGPVAGGGLVISAITARATTDHPENPEKSAFGSIPDTVPSGLAGHRWPSPELVNAAAASFTRRLPAWDGSEGPRARIEIGPGIVRVARRDLNRAEKTAERIVARRLRSTPVDDEEDEGPAKRGVITEWSAKSRANMVATISSLDMREFVVTEAGLPAMLTLTYPGDWQTVAPTSRDFKRHLRLLQLRFKRMYGRPLNGLWKLEFQRRGAPHAHIFMVVPSAHIDGVSFREWVSLAWADIVAHPDPEQRQRHIDAGTGVDIAEGLRSTDPRRVAVYFTKHSSANFGDKEYQHIVPEEWREGAGRFWGYWGLVKATTYVEVPLDDSIAAARVLRGWSRAQGTTRQVNVWRNGRFRKVRRRVSRMATAQGFVCVNDGPSIAWQIARYLDLREGS